MAGGLATGPAVIVASGSQVLVSYDFTTLTPGAVSAPSGLSFTRGSAATVQTSDQVIVTAGIGSNQMRAAQFDSGGSQKGYLHEEARTNVLTQARNTTSGNWSAGTATRTAGQGSPDGGSSATRFNMTSGQFSDFVRITTGLPTFPITYTASMWVLRGGTSDSTYALDNIFGLSAGQGNVVSGNATATWQHITNVFLYPVAANALEIIPTDGRSTTPLTGGVAAAAHDIRGDLFQLEQGAFATSTALSAGSAFARSGDRLQQTTGSAMVQNGRLSFYVKMLPLGASSAYSTNLSAIRLWTDAGDATTFVEISTSTLQLKVSVGGVTETFGTALSWSALDVLEIFVRAGNGTSEASYRKNSGSKISLGSSATSMASLAPGGAYDLLSNGTGSQFSAIVQTISAYGDGSKPSWA